MNLKFFTLLHHTACACLLQYVCYNMFDPKDSVPR